MVSECTEDLVVMGMHCAGCANDLEEAVRRLKGVSQASVSFTTGKMYITYNTEQLPKTTLIEHVGRIGFTVRQSHEEIESPTSFWQRRESIFLGIAGLLLASAILLPLTGFDPLLTTVLGKSGTASTGLYLFSVIFGLANFALRGLKAILTLSLGMNFLMTIAVVGAFSIGDHFEAASLAFLFSLAELLEERSVDRARNSLRALLKLAPNKAAVRRGEQEIELPVEQIEVGDMMLIKPGERIALDGEVILGNSAVNQASITGESVPVEKQLGNIVFAGTINQEGYLEVRVTKGTKDTTIAKIIHLVEEAEAQKAPVEKFVERFAKYYTPSVVGVAMVIALVPPLFFAAPFTGWFIRALSLLVISCPCALLISTPVSIVSAITSAARHGVLIKGGVYLEELGKVRAIAIDKTGTLTTGQLEVTDVVPLNGHSKEEVLNIAIALESKSKHPVAQAIVRHCKGSSKSSLFEVQEFESLTGQGVQARVNGQRYFVGKPELFEGLVLPTEFERLESEAKTVVLVGQAERLIGLIAVADQIRPEAKQTVINLKKLGLEVVMITGDNEGTAQAVAHKLEIDHYHAGVLPEQKLSEIQQLLAKYGSVAMVGDGVNDAPALAAASVGIAMGVVGTDAALESSDVALLADELNRLPYLIELSRKANGVIRQNIWFSILTKLSLAVGVFPGYVTLVIAVLVGDVGASLAVTGNAMRLAKYTHSK